MLEDLGGQCQRHLLESPKHWVWKAKDSPQGAPVRGGAEALGNE